MRREEAPVRKAMLSQVQRGLSKCLFEGAMDSVQPHVRRRAHNSVQNVNHEGDEHICESTNHACGLPCHLSKHGLCNLPCTIDWWVISLLSLLTPCLIPSLHSRQKHDQHRCKDRLQCPKTCQLCNRLCAARDHDHALEVGALHICG